MTSDPSANAPRPSEPWRYFRQFRTWKRGERSFVLPQCRMVIDGSKLLKETGVLYVGEVRCERLDGHDGNHRSDFPEYAQWGAAWAKETTRG